MSNNMTSLFFQVLTTEIVHAVVFWSRRHIGPNSFNSKDGCRMILRNVGVILRFYITSKP